MVIYRILGRGVLFEKEKSEEGHSVPRSTLETRDIENWWYRWKAVKTVTGPPKIMDTALTVEEGHAMRRVV